MTRLPVVGFLLAATAAPVLACADDEATLFTCLAEDKAHVIELCAVRDEAAGGFQSLRYVYGTAENTELSFPEDRRTGKPELKFAHAIDKDTYVWSLRFGSGGYTYRVFGLGEKAGVEVWKKKKRLAQVMCGADIYASVSSIRRAASCDEDNPFGKAGCGETPPARK